MNRERFSRLVYLHDIGFARGERLSVNQIAESEADKRVLRLLLTDGFKWFSRSNHNVAKLAVEAIGNCLSRANISAAEIDALVFCTESFWDIYRSVGGKAEPRDLFISEVCLAAGLFNAVPYGMWLRGCANFASALSLARALVLSGQHCNVLVVMADRVGVNATRLSIHGPTIFSDGASALIVNKQKRGYAMRSIDLHFSCELNRIRGQNNPILYGKSLVEQLHIFRKAMEKSHKTSPMDHDFLMTDNFHSFFLSILYESFSIERSRRQILTKHEGHFFSSDCVLTLLKFENDEMDRSGASLALMNVGPSGAAQVSLEAV